MSVFGLYSSYYDLLYRDKDYVGEVDYIDQLIQCHNPGAQTILDLGCGTGRHANLFAERSYEVHGVDISKDMLARARENSSLGLCFSDGDIRSIRLGKKFDVVTSLFHVISYQTTNDDLMKSFQTAYEHLNEGGIFIFDGWYGPAVLTDRPVARIKRLEDDEIAVTRIAEPVMYVNENIVDVEYHIIIKNKFTRLVEEVIEVHKMRYLFKPEVELSLNQSSFILVDYHEYLTTTKPNDSSWSVIFIGRK